MCCRYLRRRLLCPFRGDASEPLGSPSLKATDLNNVKNMVYYKGGKGEITHICSYFSQLNLLIFLNIFFLLLHD